MTPHMYITMYQSKLGFKLHSTAKFIFLQVFNIGHLWDSNPYIGDSLWLDTKHANILGHGNPNDTEKNFGSHFCRT